MTNWIIEERQQLLQQLTRSTWLALAISVPAVAICAAIAYLIGVQRDLLPGAEKTLAVLIIAVAIPAAVFVLVGLRKVFWTRAISAEAQRLQSQQFLTRYVEAIGIVGLRELSVIARAQVDTALEREKNGDTATPREYAEALRYLLLIEPT
ncbi:MAG: hypothetical protein ACLFMS_01340 [Halorhodospira sp.]